MEFSIARCGDSVAWAVALTRTSSHLMSIVRLLDETQGRREALSLEELRRCVQGICCVAMRICVC